LDIDPKFFHIVSRFVQALVIMNNDILQALSAEGNVLLLKPFLDLESVSIITSKSPVSEMFFNLPNTSRSKEAKSGLYGGWGFPEMALGAGCLLLPPGLGKFHRIL
jgi:hypothetical protein